MIVGDAIGDVCCRANDVARMIDVNRKLLHRCFILLQLVVEINVPHVVEWGARSGEYCSTVACDGNVSVGKKGLASGVA